MMRSSAYNRFGVLMGTSVRASSPPCLSLREGSLPMITLIALKGDLCATAIKLLPERPELPLFLGLDQEGDGLVDLLPRHVAFVTVLESSHRLTHHRGIHDTNGRDVQNRRLAPKLRVEE